MIILHLSGGLGNQMFQYAFGRAITKRLGVDLKLSLSDSTLNIHNGFELNRIFNINTNIATPKETKLILKLHRFKYIKIICKHLRLKFLLNSQIIQEPSFNFSSQMLHQKDNSYIIGYWQSEKYFIDIKQELLNDFYFKIPLSNKNNNFARLITLSNAISIHVRRNDFAKNTKINNTHGLCSLEYYKTATEYISKKVNNPCFFVFSDDPEWVKQNLKINFPCHYIAHNTGLESYNDMRLMSMCKHHIIANSSFSWWGAWLNSSSTKIVIAPKQWFADDKRNISDLFPINWVTL